VIAELHEVLARQRDAAETLEARLRAIELLLAAGEPRFLPLAVDEANDAAERLAALELTRVLTLSSIGAPADVSAREVADAAGGETAVSFAAVVEELRSAVARVTVRRERVRGLLVSAQAEGERRIVLAGAAELV
jgi:hypothetical protein